MKEKRTVLEWLNYSKLLEKKIDKARTMELFSVSFAYQDNKFNEDEVESAYQSYKDLVTNYDRVLNELTKYNANTDIEIGGEKYSIAYAIKLWNNKDNKHLKFIKNNYNNMIDELDSLQEQSLEEQTDLDKQLVSKQNLTEKDKAFIELTKAKYNVVQKDPLDLKSLLEKEQEKYDEFMNEVNVKINLKNAKTELEIDLV